LINLFAFPYAFGNSGIYNNLKKYLRDDINFIPLDYPGHGGRIIEPLLYSIRDIADDLFNKIKKIIESNEKYALFGYSMGGVICYELYQRIKKENLTLPQYLFIFSTAEPEFKYDSENFENYTLTDAREKLKELGGTPSEILKSEEMINYIKPIMCADLIAMRDYINDRNCFYKIECPVIVIRGDKEKTILNCKSGWEKYISGPFEYIITRGKHFFMFEEGEAQSNNFSEIVNYRLKA
jgi:medium-chain acyl-[acyl-carrier-protein] hydrolase